LKVQTHIQAKMMQETNTQTQSVEETTIPTQSVEETTTPIQSVEETAVATTVQMDDTDASSEVAPIQVSVTVTTNTVKTDEDVLREQAQAIFLNMKAEADMDAVETDDLENLLEDESNIDDLAKQHYNQQLEELKREQADSEQMKAQEIEDLKKLLAQAQKPAAKSPEKKQKPIEQGVSLNGVRSKLLICDFHPGKGRIGISFKRYGGQFFIVDTVPNGQVHKYEGIGPGLLLYQVVACHDGEKMGVNISVQHSEELGQKVLHAFGQGKKIQMSFLILPENIHVASIQQHVFKQPTFQYARY